jgi:hypothetical protein
MNPMKYPQSYLALEAAQFDRQPRMAQPLTWDDREAQQIPSYEQTAISPDPLIDLGAGFSGGFGANIMRKGLSSALRSGIAATLAEYPIGLATAGAANIDPRLAMPVSIMGGMASGASFERGLENAMAGKAHPVRTARRALGNAMGQVDVWHGSPHSFDRFSMDKIGTGEGAQAFGHGLYFTDVKDIAKYYADSLGHSRRFDGDTAHLYAAQDMVKNSYSLDETVEALKSAYPTTATQDLMAAAYEAHGITGKYIYKATLHKGKDPSEYVYLDWDKPIPKDISDKMIAAYKSGDLNLREDLGTRNFVDGLTGLSKDAFHKKLQDRGFVVKGGRVFNPSGKELPKEILEAQREQWGASMVYRDAGHFYRDLAHMLGSDREASMVLKRAGIDGIRYPQGSLSGGSGQGKNYVVFDENAITIEERKALGR